MVAMPSQESTWDMANGGRVNITASFREATDEDTRRVLNTMANPNNLQLEFYVISVQWMNTVLPYLQGSSLEKPEANIHNAPLIASEHAVSSDEDTTTTSRNNTETRRKRKQSSWQERIMAQQAANNNTEHAIPLKPNLHFQQDYFLIGPHAWAVLCEKFGYDYALPRRVIAMPTAESRMGVQVYPHEETWPVPVPATGRFSFETTAPAHDPVPQETDDMFPELTTGNDSNDMDDTEMDTLDNTTSEPVYMLPPSTTAYNYTTNDYNGMQDAILQRRKRYASGLANLGNTCFMNSTLQCLAHTDPLRRHFLSREYLQDLNKDNPLGTGGELATEFANLLKEMWISNKASYHAVVYPRDFKVALGRHAEQFLGYDQHDSQEFATYLLDALHEDTNRITRKPYIEKPEQKENETDDQAAELAWKLHLQREDSRVLENFMGQVKSRVQCPTDGCGRVSTTFDPFMYLSVPIPGATDVTIPVTFVTLHHGNYRMQVTVKKTASIETLQKKVAKKWNELKGLDIAMKNMVSIDVWNSCAYHWYTPPSEEVDRIVVDRDMTYIYELKSLDDFDVDTGDNTLAMDALESNRRYRRHSLDAGTLTQLNQDNWEDALSKYMAQPLNLARITNAKRSSHEERVAFYQKLEAFIELCHSSSDGQDSDTNEGAEMATKDENPQEDSSSMQQENEDSLPSLEERCASSSFFRNVKEVKDLAILEHCSEMLRQKILSLLEESTSKYDKEGIVIEIRMRHKNTGTVRSPSFSTGTSNGGYFSAPLCIRVPPNMTVYGLREELASRLSKYLKTDYLSRKPPPPPSSEDMDTKIAASDVTPEESNEGSDQSDVPMESTYETSNGDSKNRDLPSPSKSTFDLGSPELLILRQVPLTYNREGSKNNVFSRQLGMLDTYGTGSLDGHPMTLANKDDEAEQHTIAEVVGNQGSVQLNWSHELYNRTFDIEKYEAVETVEDPDAASRNAAKKTITVKDCIDKYCHMEQLDETEMWYCNRCKDHVRAWKQFHLYRSPPILIVHLKRFHYSSATHRRDKIDTFIDFPLTGLDLTNEFTHWTEDEKPIYDCYAVSNHFGGLGGGHYTAFALSDEGTWSNFDDSRVTTDVDPKDVVSNAAYVLYYRRRDVVLDGPEVEVSPPLPAIVQDSYFQPREESNARLDLDCDGMDADMQTDDFATDVHSTASSVASQMDSVDIDPYGYDEVENFKSNLPSQ